MELMNADRVRRAAFHRREGKELIRELWSRIGNITVQCPYCSFAQECQTIKPKTCINCGRSFQIMPERRPSRIVSCPKNKIVYLHNIRSLEKYGKFMSVF